LRERSTSIKQSRVFLRENKTKVNYDKWDYLNNLEDSRVADSQVICTQCASQCHYCDRGSDDKGKCQEISLVISLLSRYYIKVITKL